MYDDQSGGVVLHLTSGAYFGLNPVGAAVWDLIGEHGSTVGQLVQSLRDRLEDVPDDVEADVREFLEALVARDLVQVSDGSAP